MKPYSFDLSINRAVFSDQDYIKAMQENKALRDKLKKQNLSNRAYHGWSTKRKHNIANGFNRSEETQLKLFKTAC